MITKGSGFQRFEQRLGINTGKLADGREAGGGAGVVSELSRQCARRMANARAKECGVEL